MAKNPENSPEFNWTHRELQIDLATKRIGIGEAIVTELALGFWGGSGSMDVFTMKLSRTNPLLTCYEVKASRADFLSDIRTRKYRRYEPYAERCYFATPAKLVTRSEVPEGWGLISRGPRGWHTVKGAPRYKPEDAAYREVLLAFVLALHPGPWAEQPRHRRIASIMEFLDGQDQEMRTLRTRARAKNFGYRVAKIVQGRE